MIPRRPLESLASPNVTPGVVPLPPEALKDGPEIAPVGSPPVVVTLPPAKAAQPKVNQSQQILAYLERFSTVRKVPETRDEILFNMEKRGLITCSSGYAVVTGKGIDYLADFCII